MTERRRPDTRTRPEGDAGSATTRPDDPRETDLDPGAFVGNRPERQAETIPGGVRPDDERIAANSSQATGTVDGAISSGGRAAKQVLRALASQLRT